MKKVIVTTTINAPTEAIEKFDAMPDWTLIVIGDINTPKDYKLKRGLYVTPEEQEKYDKALSHAIGWNCIQRRNFGFLLAKDMGADIIATVDDDNIPLNGWGDSLLLGKETKVNYYRTSQPCFDPVGATPYSHLWHRGFPIQLLKDRDYSTRDESYIIPNIQADFWNGDPDVDAICRMEHKPDCEFKDDQFPFASNAISPFNSQNTFLLASVLKDYFMFPGVGRMDDIWAAYWTQHCGHKVVYNKASVIQRRNEHDLTKDMLNEFQGYVHNERIVKDPKLIFDLLPERSKLAFQLYQKHFA